MLLAKSHADDPLFLACAERMLINVSSKSHGRNEKKYLKDDFGEDGATNDNVSSLKNALSLLKRLGEANHAAVKAGLALDADVARAQLNRARAEADERALPARWQNALLAALDLLRERAAGGDGSTQDAAALYGAGVAETRRVCVEMHDVWGVLYLPEQVNLDVNGETFVLSQRDGTPSAPVAAASPLDHAAEELWLKARCEELGIPSGYDEPPGYPESKARRDKRIRKVKERIRVAEAAKAEQEAAVETAKAAEAAEAAAAAAAVEAAAEEDDEMSIEVEAELMSTSRSPSNRRPPSSLHDPPSRPQSPHVRSLAQPADDGSQPLASETNTDGEYADFNAGADARYDGLDEPHAVAADAADSLEQRAGQRHAATLRHLLEREGIRAGLSVASDKAIAAAAWLLHAQAGKKSAPAPTEAVAATRFSSTAASVRAYVGHLQELQARLEGAEVPAARVTQLLSPPAPASAAGLHEFHPNKAVQEAALAFQDGEARHRIDHCSCCDETRFVAHATPPLDVGLSEVREPARPDEGTRPVELRPWRVRYDGWQDGKAMGVCERCFKVRAALPSVPCPILLDSPSLYLSSLHCLSSDISRSLLPAGSF